MPILSDPSPAPAPKRRIFLASSAPRDSVAAAGPSTFRFLGCPSPSPPPSTGSAAPDLGVTSGSDVTGVLLLGAVLNLPPPCEPPAPAEAPEPREDAAPPLPRKLELPTPAPSRALEPRRIWILSFLGRRRSPQNESVFRAQEEPEDPPFPPPLPFFPFPFFPPLPPPPPLSGPWRTRLRMIGLLFLGTPPASEAPSEDKCRGRGCWESTDLRLSWAWPLSAPEPCRPPWAWPLWSPPLCRPGPVCRWKESLECECDLECEWEWGWDCESPPALACAPGARKVRTESETARYATRAPAENSIRWGSHRAMRGEARTHSSHLAAEPRLTRS